jgi:glycosyltransferase involved in cell wall biosynthesis
MQKMPSPDRPPSDQHAVRTVPRRIALVLIARDEARAIERCLQSVRPWVDEMVVLDTGSVDDTPAIAARCGARVTHFAWIDDFAAARNAALALTDADWCLVLDADEWIEDGGRSLAAVRDAEPGFIGQLNVVSLIEDDSGRVERAPSWLSRLLPRGVRYEGRVHEQPATALPRRRLALTIGHDGYQPAQRDGKRGRNRRLLQLALAAQPDDAYLRYQLGKDHEVHDEFDAAALHYAQADGGPDDAAWRHDWIVRRLYTLKRLARFEEALGLAEAAIPRWSGSPDFFFTIGDLLLGWAAAEPAHAEVLLPMIESSWLRALEIGECPQLQDSVVGRGSFLAAHNLAVLHEGLGDAAQARYWRDREAALRRIHAGPPGVTSARAETDPASPNWPVPVPHFEPSPGAVAA